MRKPRIKGVLSAQTIESLMANTDEVGDCNEWKGYFCNGTPMVSHNGQMMSVRRLMLELQGEEVPTGTYAIPKCDNGRCVCSEHTVLETGKKRVKRIGALSAGNPMRNAAVSATRRRLHAKLNIEQAREIRGSEDSYSVLAERFGVTKTMVGHIKRGVYWKEHSSPFARLGAR